MNDRKIKHKYIKIVAVSVALIILLSSLALAADSISLQFNSLLERIQAGNKNLQIMDISKGKLPLNLDDAREARSDLASDASDESKLQADMRVRSAMRASTNLDYQKRIQEKMLQANLEQLYISYHSLSGQLDVMQGYLELLEQQAALVGVQYEQGLATATAVAEIDQELQKARLNNKELQGNLDAMLDQIKLQLGVPVEQSVRLESFNSSSIMPIRFNESVTKALENNLEIKLLREQLEWKESDKQLIRSRLGNTSNQYKLAELEEQELILQISLAEEQLRFTMEDEHRSFLILLAKYEVALRASKLQAQELALAQVRYDNGAIGSLELTRAHWLYSQAQQEERTARRDYYAAYNGFRHLENGMPVMQ